MYLAHTPKDIYQSTSLDSGPAVGSFLGLSLKSTFQPVFSIAHGRPVGYEALLRAERDGVAVAPLDVFQLAGNVEDRVHLDRLCRMVHARNFKAAAADAGWLFLNLHPAILADDRSGERGRFFSQVLERCGIPPHRVVIEVVESAFYSHANIGRSIEVYRDLGCLVAVDDFGSGYSNFDRVWRLKPDIVKLDRLLVNQASEDGTARLFLKRITSMMHEVGSLVLAEGVEREAEAIIALDANVDMLQGFYFARPSPVISRELEVKDTFDRLRRQFRRLSKLEQRDYEAEVAPYIEALTAAAQRMEKDIPFSLAARDFLELPLAERCFLLDHDGHQIEHAASPAGKAAEDDLRYGPVAQGAGSNWGHRYYFRRAISRPGRAHVTRPYLSLPTATKCVTVSIAANHGSEKTYILCGDIQWSEKLSTDVLADDTTMPGLLG